MFAKQMAVMKGQAWNVVETLKTADHGPLELTRRPKVCVWDDLVDVPIAIPMRVTSAEMRRQSDAAASETIDYFSPSGASTIEEEMDIGAASSSAPAPGVVDLLGISSPSGPADLPHPGRFELTPQPSPLVQPHSPNGSLQSSLVLNGDPAPKGATAAGADRPPPPRHSFSTNSALPAHNHRSLNMYSPERDRGGAAAAAARREHQRRFSFATAAGRRNSNNIAHQLYRHDLDEDDDGLEGDLGYAAAEGMEGNQRKVIVERLEPVKTRNPVFTCW
jgi:phosphatidylinositol 4-kinase type 2